MIGGLIMNEELKEWLSQNKIKALGTGVKCGICNQWFLKHRINHHLALKHPKEYKRLLDKYYQLVEDYKK
jgi:hypothetical protein